MITRFDHAVIAVADLDRAMEAYSALGFDVFPGGRHEHRGTHNALIRFGGADYIELLGIYDSERAIESGLNGRTLAEFVRYREGGLVGHCYATDDIVAEAERTREAGLEMVGPFEMKRERPDGRALTWRLLVPQDIPWRRRWPFFIEWNDPDEVRLAVEGVGDHANGARSVSSVAVAVKDLQEAVRLYSVLFDVEPFRRDEVTDLTATRASFDVRGFTIDLLSPTGNGPVRKSLERDGEGPFEVKIEVEDLLRARLALSGVEFTENAAQGELRPPTEASLGARLGFTKQA
ncbi:MAG TPA: VOC family protein [Rubrobacter sp.]|nr:VOC family protein [Rubrobacter sp.]